MKWSQSERIRRSFRYGSYRIATWKIIVRRIRWRAAVGGNMSGTHRCCLRLLSISRVHTDVSHPGKVTRWCATDLFIDRGFDLARGYRFRVVASWRVILSAIHNVSATTGESSFSLGSFSRVRSVREFFLQILSRALSQLNVYYINFVHCYIIPQSLYHCNVVC